MASAYINISNRTDDSDSVDDREAPAPSRNPRSSGACVHCKSLKVRCEFTPGQRACKRCDAGGFPCLSRTRKKRKPAPTQEDLQEKSFDQDRVIQDLLRKFEQMRMDQKLKVWRSRAQMDQPHSDSDSHTSPPGYYDTGSNRPHTGFAEPSAEVAVSKFFQGKSSLPPPDIVKYCPLFPDEILDLFTIYWERINPFFSLLDSDYHVPSNLIWTSPFLFTVICAVASRYYTKRPNLYSIAMDFARDAAGKSLIEGSKTIDVCQAYLILAVYPVPKKKWADDRSWMLIGVACRMALELELHIPPSTDLPEREQLNRMRTWLNCFCVDGSHAIQFGKMPMLRLDDYTAQHSSDWYKSSLSTPYDIHLCGYVQIIIIMAQWRKQCKQEHADCVSLAEEFEGKLSNEIDRWVRRYAQESNHSDINRYRGNTTQLIAAYLRLVVLSYGFQHAFKAGISRGQYVVQESMRAAEKVISIMTDRLYPAGHLRYAMEAHFLYVAFAAAYLINFLRPKFLPLLDERKQGDIVTIVRRLIDVLGSNDVALDYRHTPALYSRFLSNQMDRYHPKSSNMSPASSANSDEVKFVPQFQREREMTPPHIQYSWPDVNYANADHDDGTGSLTPGSGDYPGMIYQRSGDADMDFSINHFVSSVNTQDASTAYAGPSGGVPGYEAWNYQAMPTMAFDSSMEQSYPFQTDWPPDSGRL